MILGDFELRREIGRGGMGTVYEAWQRSLQRIVAVKVLERHVSATAKAVLRFQREAQAAAKLHHTHIVPIYAQAETDGVYYYAMEFIEGCGLNAIIADLRGTAGPDASTVDLAETVALSPSREAVIRTRSASDGPTLLGYQDPALALGVRIRTTSAPRGGRVNARACPTRSAASASRRTSRTCPRSSIGFGARRRPNRSCGAISDRRSRTTWWTLPTSPARSMPSAGLRIPIRRRRAVRNVKCEVQRSKNERRGQAAIARLKGGRGIRVFRKHAVPHLGPPPLTR